MGSSEEDVSFIDWIKEQQIFLVLFALWIMFILYSTSSMIMDPEYSGQTGFIIFGGLVWILIPLGYKRFKWRQSKSE